jgi:hypothetical protein
MTPRMFSIDLSRHENVAIAAADRDAAADQAEQLHPGFAVEGMVELGSYGGAKLAEHTPMARCEGCRRRIWEGEIYAADEDGCYTCATCLASIGLKP